MYQLLIYCYAWSVYMPLISKHPVQIAYTQLQRALSRAFHCLALDILVTTVLLLITSAFVIYITFFNYRDIFTQTEFCIRDEAMNTIWKEIYIH